MKKWVVLFASVTQRFIVTQWLPLRDETNRREDLTLERMKSHNGKDVRCIGAR